jgi:hypothetical protein
LALGLSATAAEDGPYPVWWSPALELECLDAIDARLERALWTHESDGMPLIKSEGDTRIEVWANSCNDLERLIEEGHSAAGSHDYWVQQYQLAVCRAIEMMRRAKPAKRSFLRDFVLNEDSIDYLPAMVDISPSCDMLCRQRVANERRIPLSAFEPVFRVTVTSDEEIEIRTIGFETDLTILARADFNHDGLEDMLALSSGGSISGRGAWADVFLLTREKPGAVLYDLNADKGYCPDYQCAEVYDYPKTLRETNPQPAE